MNLFSQIQQKAIWPLFLIAAFGLPSCSDQSPTAVNTQDTSNNRGAMRVYKDPVTGKFVSPPAGSQSSLPPAAVNNRQSTTSVMKEVPIPGISGGTMVNLKGRFRKNLMATKDATGKITITHQPAEGTIPNQEN